MSVGEVYIQFHCWNLDLSSIAFANWMLACDSPVIVALDSSCWCMVIYFELQAT